ncbi:heat stress transcription factor B-3-like [Senna tora]|uniref:Heat stress transcription factor B-3-like n=1 Tax=Senna tora TaxID=362788 RepID=A0A834SCP2_9FABA|nr:heat stress transcription factor B-3-like [Senna tora]
MIVDHVLTYSGRQIAVGAQKPSRITMQKTCCASESNRSGFHKVTTSRWEFCNKQFRKGEKELLCEIRRRKAWANNNNNSKQIKSAATSLELKLK